MSNAGFREGRKASPRRADYLYENGSNQRAVGLDARSMGRNPRAQGTNPRAQKAETHRERHKRLHGQQRDYWCSICEDERKAERARGEPTLSQPCPACDGTTWEQAPGGFVKPCRWCRRLPT